MPSDTVLANAALDKLKAGGSNYWPRTRMLLSAVCTHNFWDVEHLHFRNVLNRLHFAGLLDRHGKGSFRWRFKEGATWDRTNPFVRQSGAPKPQVEQADEDGGSIPRSQLAKDFLKVRDEMVRLKAENDQLAKMSQERGEANALLNEALKKVKEELDQASQKVKTIHVHYHDGTKVKLKDKVLPKAFDRVKELAECRRNVLLVGPAGAGKSYLAKLVADILKLDFGSLSCTAGMSEAHLLGRSVPDLTHGKNRFQGTDFLRIYEEGGVFLLDELDAADPNLLLCVNTGLANGYLNVPNRPDRPRAVRHKDNVCIGTANTFGRGATRMYSGRNQLDEATIDRFRIGVVEVYYDHLVENAVCPDIGGEKDRSWLPPTMTNGDHKDRTVEALVARGYNLRQTCQFVRHKIEASGLRRIMSTRFMEDAYVMMAKAKWDMRAVLETFFSGWTEEERAKIC